MAGKNIVKIVGSAGKKKHEITSDDSRDSFTMFQTGVLSGTTGPTVFLVKDKYVRVGFSTAYLEKFGLAKGLMIIANQNAYMNTEAWEEITPSIIRGYCNMSTHTKAMSNWWIFEIVTDLVHMLPPTRQ